MTFSKQKGTTTVEFAIIGTVLMLVLLLTIEMSRLIFVLNTLGEVTRRGARVAAVCPVNDPEIARAAIFSSVGTDNSPLVHDLDTGNIRLTYLDENGGEITGVPSDPDVFVTIRYVRVEIQNYVHRMVLPVPVNFTMPRLASTFPRESLGIPRQGVIQSCSVG